MRTPTGVRMRHADRAVQMERLTHYPFLLFAISFVTLTCVALAGSWFRRRYGFDDEQNEHLGIILASTLTLLSLIIGFSFSMAASRYDQRKNLEEAEANAIGTEILRADLLPAADAAKVRQLLRDYIDQRILFFLDADDDQRERVNQETAKLQASLWAAVRAPVAAQPTPVEALALAGMNDVINSQGYTRAAYRNRIPVAAWILLVIIALFSSALLGFRSRHAKHVSGLVFVLPMLISFAFLLIADIDAPRHGLIEVRPDNLESLAKSLHR
jgi:cation transporter-like permease